MFKTTARARTRGPTVFLHIGTPKSGTTYVQSRFTVNHKRAAAQGLLWPGPSWYRHVRAAEELRRLADGERPPQGGYWERIALEAAGWGGESVLVSMEWLASLTPYQARVAVETLHPLPVEVVCTVRDLQRSFVAQGQEMTKNFRTWTWERLVREVLRDTGGRATRTFWRQQDTPRILRRWLEVVPADRVHLVTVPPAGSDPETLWQRFCSVVGVDGSGFDLPPKNNASLGVVSTKLMQRLNTVAARRGLSRETYMQALHHGVAVDVLESRRGEEDPIALSPEMERFLARRARTMVGELKELGVRLHGEWDDLLPSPAPLGRRPEEVTDAELLRLCTEVLVTLAVSSYEQAPGTRRLFGRTIPRSLSAGDVKEAAVRAGRRARGAVRGRPPRSETASQAVSDTASETAPQTLRTERSTRRW